MNATLGIIIALVIVFACTDDEYADRKLQAKAHREMVVAARIAAAQHKREIKADMAKWDFLQVKK